MRTQTQYFDVEAFLSQSGQLYGEAGAAALGKIYCFGPTFRAEKSKTRRHLTEFWMLEPEAYFAHLADMMDLAEGLVSHIVQSVVSHRRPELETLKRDIPKLEAVKLPFPRPVIMQGQRLPASYANFYIANATVVVPTFNDRNDRVALNTIAELLPDREVVGIHAVDLVWGLGTLHCLTQQQPVRQ